MDTRKLQTQLNQLLTVQELRMAFGEVTAVTIHTWRHREGLPTIVVPGLERPSIRFHLPDVQRWAKENNRPLNLKLLPKRKGVRHGRSGTASQSQKAA